MFKYKTFDDWYNELYGPYSLMVEYYNRPLVVQDIIDVFNAARLMDNKIEQNKKYVIEPGDWECATGESVNEDVVVVKINKI